MALSGNKTYVYRAETQQVRGNLPVPASVHIYAGALLATTDAGALVPLQHADAEAFAGISEEEVVTGAGETSRCEFSYGHEVALPVGSITAASVGFNLGATDDNTLSDDPEDNLAIGELKEIDDDGAWVSIKKYTMHLQDLGEE